MRRFIKVQYPSSDSYSILICMIGVNFLCLSVYSLLIDWRKEDKRKIQQLRIITSRTFSLYSTYVCSFTYVTSLYDRINMSARNPFLLFVIAARGSGLAWFVACPLETTCLRKKLPVNSAPVTDTDGALRFSSLLAFREREKEREYGTAAFGREHADSTFGEMDNCNWHKPKRERERTKNDWRAQTSFKQDIRNAILNNFELFIFGWNLKLSKNKG